MRLDKEEFYDMLESRIHDDFPKYELSRQEVAKSNNTVKCGLVVRDPDNEVAPSLRIDDYWKDYLEADDYEAAEENENYILIGFADKIIWDYPSYESNTITRKQYTYSYINREVNISNKLIWKGNLQMGDLLLSALSDDLCI